MILGTCNMGMVYNNYRINPKEDVFKCFEAFEKQGGKILDTALNYGDAHSLIKEYGWKHKIITKAWNRHQLDQCFETLGTDHIYCIMARDSKDNDLMDTLHRYKNDGMIDKVGVSIYYPHETIQRTNVYGLPFSPKWLTDLPEMILHADIYVRSFWNLGVKSLGIYKAKEWAETLKKYSRPDLNHVVDFIVGVNNLGQLKEDMELFNEL